MYAQETVSGETACCANCSKRDSFQPVMEIKSLGVTIMRYVADIVRHIVPRSTIEVISGNDNEHKNHVFIIINANQHNLSSEDILPKFDINKVPCSRCRYRAQKIQKMLQNKVDIGKTDIRGICDHCKDKLSHETCPICEGIVNKFLASSEKSGFPRKSLHFHRPISARMPTLEEKQYFNKTKPRSATDFVIEMTVMQPESDTEYLTQPIIPIKNQVERKAIEYKKEGTPIISNFSSDESFITPFATSFFKAENKIKDSFKYFFPKDVDKVEDTAKTALKTSSELIMATQEKLRKEYEKEMAKEKEDRKEKNSQDGDNKSSQNELYIGKPRSKKDKIEIGGEREREIKDDDKGEASKEKYEFRDLENKVARDKKDKKSQQEKQYADQSAFKDQKREDKVAKFKKGEQEKQYSDQPTLKDQKREDKVAKDKKSEQEKQYADRSLLKDHKREDKVAKDKKSERKKHYADQPTSKDQKREVVAKDKKREQEKQYADRSTLKDQKREYAVAKNKKGEQEKQYAGQSTLKNQKREDKVAKDKKGEQEKQYPDQPTLKDKKREDKVAKDKKSEQEKRYADRSTLKDQKREDKITKDKKGEQEKQYSDRSTLKDQKSKKGQKEIHKTPLGVGGKSTGDDISTKDKKGTGIKLQSETKQIDANKQPTHPKPYKKDKKDEQGKQYADQSTLKDQKRKDKVAEDEKDEQEKQYAYQSSLKDQNRKDKVSKDKKSEQEKQYADRSTLKDQTSKKGQEKIHKGKSSGDYKSTKEKKITAKIGIDDSGKSQSMKKGSSETKMKMQKNHKGDKKLLPLPLSAPPESQPPSKPPPKSQPSKSSSPPKKEDEGAKAKKTEEGKEKSKTVPTDKDKKKKEKIDKDGKEESGKDEKGITGVKITKIETEPPPLILGFVPKRNQQSMAKAISKQIALAEAQAEMKDFQEACLQKARADVANRSTLPELHGEYFLFRIKVGPPISPLSEEKKTPHRHKKLKELTKFNFNKVKVHLSLQNLIFKIIKEKKKKDHKEMSKHKSKYNIRPVKRKFSVGSMSIDSDLESLIESMTNLRIGIFVRHKIFHTDIVRNILEKPRRKLQLDPILYHAKQTGESESLQIFDLEKEQNQTQEPEKPNGILRYTLSDRSFINNGWTLLPTEKIVRKLNIYKVRPTNPEFDWFNNNRKKGMLQYDTGEKLAEFDEDGRGRLYYKNGRLALDYYDCEEANAQQRFVIYSSGESNERCRTLPVTVLAMFDYLGSGVVFDHGGKIRIKYNQTEGVVLDRAIGPITHWKWHTLNDPPILKQVMIDTHMDTPDPIILSLGMETETRLDDEQVLQIELDNFIKEKTKKLNQNFQPIQIKVKALKINEQFSLRILDQAHIYLHFNDGSSHIKMNLGMVLDNQEIIDTETSDYNEVANSLERPFPKTDSIFDLQTKIKQARHCEYMRREHKEWVRPTIPVCSADKLVSAVSKPLRPPPLSTCPLSCKPANFKRKPSDFNVYYATRLI